MTTLVPRFTLGSLDLTDYPYSVEFGSNQGAPESAVALLSSLLPDGDLVSLTRRSNRTVTLTVLIEGADLDEISAAEAALTIECNRALNTLTIDPGDGFATATAFDTFGFDPQRVFDDDLERSTLRRWVLEIPAMPFRRGTELIIDDAGTPPSSGGVLLYNCESTTGWASWGTPGTYAVDSTIFTEGAGAMRSQAPSANITTGSHLWYFYWVAFFTDQVTGLSLDTDTGGYLSLALRVEYSDIVPGGPESGPYGFWMQVDGVWEEVTSFVAARRDDADFVHYVWPVDAGLTITGLRMQVRQVKSDNSGSGTDGFPHRPYTWYDDVELLPAATTDHQIVKQLTVEGSARTTGSLRVSAPSESVALGHVLAITAPTSELPAGFQPDGRRWATQGETSNDPTLGIHGGDYFTPDTSTYSDATGTPDRPIFDVPVNMLTAGPYTMVALVKAESASLTFGAQAQLRIAGTDVGPTSTAEQTVQGLTTGWQFVTVGTIEMPPLPIRNAGTDTFCRLLFKGAKMADVYFIPAWEVGGSPVADFSIVDCGTGTVEPGGASSSLWIDSPAVGNSGLGAWWRGPTTDRGYSQSAWPDAKKPGVHTFRPGPLSAFLVSTDAAGPTLALEYFDRYL